jgi:hypothetical protein
MNSLKIVLSNIYPREVGEIVIELICYKKFTVLAHNLLVDCDRHLSI